MITKIFSTVLFLVILSFSPFVPVALGQGQAPAQQGIPAGQVAQAARTSGEKLSGAMREVISHERLVLDLMRSGNAAPSAMAGAMRNRAGARQRADLALVQLIQAQGNPQGIGTAIAGAQRQVQVYDQSLANQVNKPPSASKDRQMQQTLRDRNRAQDRLSQYIQRWNATINTYLLSNARAQRQGLTNNIDGALREIGSYDQQLAGNFSGGNAAANPLEDRIQRLENQINQDRQQLERIEHKGATKAAQSPDATRLLNQISKNERELENLNRQLGTKTQQQTQNELRQQASIQQNRINALERYRVALDQLLQFDARLQ